ncbi:MAG: HNH endonuclease [Elusimicrobia bacterium]|nr:HNH endonuclease [Elusimicrobiota bacterium]MDE2426669.1 HNH endonuclease [Elusimicrobiota bacterium]
MPNRTAPTVAELKAAFRYDPETGFLYRKRKEHKDARGRSAEGWNRRWEAAPVGTPNARGYLVVRFAGKNMYVHRIAVALHTGELPSSSVDHINHDKKDNRASNLRVVSHRENLMNQHLRPNNTSGQMGVYWSQSARKWVAEVYVEGRSVYVGGYAAREDAIRARKDAEVLYGFHPNHGAK